MQDVATLLVHLIWSVFRSLTLGGVRSMVAEALLVKHKLLTLNRSRERAPSLRPADRPIAGLCAAMIRPSRLLRAAIMRSTLPTMPRPEACA
jgi:hypothetical protein